MTTYRAKTGTGVALESLTVLSPQPRSVGLQYTRRSYAADGSVVQEGPYVDLVWDVLDDATAYTAILTVFGLHNATQAAVTVYIRNERYAWVRYNGVALLPEVGSDASWQRFFLRDVRIVVRNLEVVT